MKPLLIYLLPFLAIITSCNNHPVSTQQQTSQSDTYPWAMLSFEKVDSVNPIMGPGTNSFTDPITNKTILWEEKDVFNPSAVVKDGKVYLLYRAQDKVGLPGGTSRIGLAVSNDGIHFTRSPNPVLYPDNDAQKSLEWQGGCEDPRIVEDSAGTYYMTYTAFDGDTARMLVASSTDLVRWIKHGSAFAGHSQYSRKWSKSGSIVSRYTNGKIVATKINGRYWMYWGDKFIWAATSDDLVHWSPIEMAPGEKPPVELVGQAVTMPNLKIILPTRRGKFDSDVVESGPPAMLTNEGILLIYNSRNIPSIGDTALAEGTYTAAQALFDKNNPLKVLHRMDDYFMKPEKPYETTGQVNQVVFIEGMVNFKGKWFLYYGTADSKIAVAVREEK